MAQNITVAVDAMGGDNAPDVVLEGCAALLEADSEINIALVGLADIVEPFAANHNRVIAVPASEVIEMSEHPAQAVRKKKDSSLVVAAKLVKDGKAQGLFSAGSTGAVLAVATLIIGRVKGISRPMLSTILPTPTKPVLLCDIGANADCKPSYMVQFAQMGSIYMQRVMSVDNPSVCLVNIGEEAEKGSTFAREAYAEMSALPNFAGNAEGRDILPATHDVFVTDGFTGNVILKVIEGTAKSLLKELKATMTSSFSNKLAAAVLKNDVKVLAERMNADTYGGAPLLGVKAACLVGHGSSNALAIKNGILYTAEIARMGVPELIGESISQVSSFGEECEPADSASGESTEE